MNFRNKWEKPRAFIAHDSPRLSKPASHCCWKRTWIACAEFAKLSVGCAL